MRLKPGDQLQSPSSGPPHAIYRVMAPIHESHLYAFYAAKRFFWNIDRRTGGKGEQCLIDDALDVVLKTILYARPQDRAYVDLRRKAFDLELRFLKTRSTNLIPEPLDELTTKNDQDAFTFPRADRLRASEPVLVFEKIHGQPLSSFMASHPNGVDDHSARHVLDEIVDLIDALHRKRWSACNLSPDQLMIDPAFGIYVTGTGSFCQLSGVEIEPPHIDLRRSAPGYQAPELVRGATADRRADFFTWGAIAALILTGTSPTTGAGGQVELDGAAHEKLRRRASMSGIVPLIKRCLSVDPEDRPPDAATLRRWWSSPPPSRPRWAISLAQIGSARGTVYVEPSPDKLELVARPGGPSTELLLGESNAVSSSFAKIPFSIQPNAALFVRSVNSSGEKSGGRSVRQLDAQSAADICSFVRENLSYAGADGGRSQGLRGPLAPLLQEGGGPVRAALAAAPEPTLKRIAIEAQVAAGDVEALLHTIRTDADAAIRSVAVVRTLEGMGAKGDVQRRIAEAAVPSEPWPAVEAALKALQDHGAPATWIEGVRGKRWEEQPVSCTVCAALIRRREEGTHYGGKHGYVRLGTTWLSPEKWRSVALDRLRDSRIERAEVVLLWGSMEEKLGRSGAIAAVLEAEPLSRGAHLGPLLRTIPEASTAIVEALLLAGDLPRFLIGVELAQKVLVDQQAAGALLKHGLGSGNEPMRIASAQALVRAGASNAARAVEVARRLVRARRKAETTIHEEVADIESQLVEMASWGLLPVAVDEARARARDSLPVVCVECQAAVARTALDSHLASVHGMRAFRDFQGTPSQAIEKAVEAYLADRNDIAAHDGALSLAQSADKEQDLAGAIRALLELRRVTAAKPRVDEALAALSPWKVEPQLLRSLVCDVTCRGEALSRRAKCSLRFSDGQESTHDVSVSRPWVFVAWTVLGTFAAMVLLSVMGIGGKAFLTGAALSAVGAAFAGYYASEGGLTASDIVFIELLPRFHNHGFDPLHARFLSRLVSSVAVPRRVSELVLWDTVRLTIEALQAGEASADDVWPLVRLAINRKLDASKGQRRDLLKDALRRLVDEGVGGAAAEVDRTFGSMRDEMLVDILSHMAERGSPLSQHVGILVRLVAARDSIPSGALSRLETIHQALLKSAATGLMPVRAAVTTLKLIDKAGAASKEAGIDRFVRAFGALFAVGGSDVAILGDLDVLLAGDADSAWRLCVRARAVAVALGRVRLGGLSGTFPKVAELIRKGGGDPAKWETGLRRLGRIDVRLDGRARSEIGLLTVLDMPLSAWRGQDETVDLIAVSSEGVVRSRGVEIEGHVLHHDPGSFEVRIESTFVQTGWTYQRKDGGRDLRYSNNPPVGYNRIDGASIRWRGGELQMRDANQAQARAARLELLVQWAFASTP